ncbi:diguanylate cyclase [Bowmanella yangjiangensis]|uniref:diguanylate cyclase n=1 Tax=Bowmanella yangjiangensis TaxID=2811230 RepID=A0ABS3CRY8_9ALTE|nr:diguanylate cyclase [Bowmanella yangjiangensis]MBN7819191.1 diguanylate cyclase [Bowmanella yangjiangensis]
MLNSLRTKLTLSMLITSLAAISVMALITPWLLEQRFISEAKDVHFKRFVLAIEEFRQEHGEWGGLQSALLINQYLSSRPARNLPPPGRRPPHPNPPASSLADNFRFVLADQQGYIFLPFFEYELGQQLTTEQLQQATPLWSGGELVGYALSGGELPLTEQDKSYLMIQSRSMLIGAAAGLAVTLLLSLTMGSQLVKHMRALTRAAIEMSKGNLNQRVQVAGKDEVALLAREFNRMAQELSNTYAELKASNETIKAQAEALQELSLRDELTGLHNRRYFNQQFRMLHHQAIRYQDTLALALGDIDNFKQINDRYSHQIGDAVLKQVAALMQEEIREADILARYGGEEFVILMAHTDKHQAEGLVDRVRAKVEAWPWEKLAKDLQVTISFGISDKLDSDLGHSMLVEADNRLYQAKDLGRNRVCA